MNPVLPKTTRFGGFYDALYKPGRFVFTAPDRVDQIMTRLGGADNPSLLQKLLKPVLKPIAWFTKCAVSYDYNKMIPVGKLRVAQAPIGALVMMFLPFTILPRMGQALKRGNGNKDEFWDILRRDVPTIGMLLFALDPLVDKLNILKSKIDGMTMVKTIETRGANGTIKKTFGSVFSYSELARNFKITRPNTLYEIARQGNAKGMEKALGNISKQWLKNPYLGNAKRHEIETFQNAVSGMLSELSKNENADETLAKSLSAKAFEALGKLDTFRASRFGSLTERELPKLADFMVRHARTRRLPIDILSFAMVAVGIGWLPVWFNDLWSRKEYAKKQAGEQPATPAQGLPAANNSFDPAATFRALRQSSPLAQQYAGSTNPFVGA